MIFVVLLNVLGLANVVMASLYFLGAPVLSGSPYTSLELLLFGLVMILVAQLLRAYLKRRQT